MLPITTDDFHTGGEPFRIVTGGVPEPVGTTVLDRRAWSEANLDTHRALLINEPRGHADMYGCLVTPPDPEPGEPGRPTTFGLVFFHKDGFSTACGHGTIAATTWGLETGRIAAVAPTTSIFVDVPSGRLRVDADVEVGPGVQDGVRVGEVRFENVPAWVSGTSIEVTAMGRSFVVDVSYGGAFYASADVAQLGVTITPENLPVLVEAGRAIKWAINEHTSVVHPVDDRLSGCYGTIWFERLGTASDGRLHQRNVTVFADGEVDRSPCGSGTSARLALLDHHRELQRGAALLHQSVIGSTFSGIVLGDGPEIAGGSSGEWRDGANPKGLPPSSGGSSGEWRDGANPKGLPPSSGGSSGEWRDGANPKGLPPSSGRSSVRTQVGGRAHRTGRHEFFLDPADAVGLGFQLR
jgi:proline racemase